MWSLCVRSLCVLGLCAGWGWADNSCVQFDVAETVSCRPLELPEQPVAVSGGEMLVEATFEVSSLIHLASEDRLLQLLYVLESPQRTAQVVDYAPKTQMASPVAGHLNVESQTDQSSSWAIDAGTHGVPWLSATASGAASSTSSSTARYELLPPLQLLASSGTVARGSAVYFKLRPSPQTSLDGARRFTVVLRVPQAWRADLIRLHCVAFERTATGILLGDGKPICGSAEFLVGIYRQGDAPARAAAQRLANTERTLRELARKQTRLIERQRYASWTDRFAVLLSASEPRIPEAWLQQVLQDDTARRDYEFQRHLPDDVRRATQDFVAARWQLCQLSQSAQDGAHTVAVGTERQASTASTASTSADRLTAHGPINSD